MSHIEAKKSLGQHFLTSKKALAEMVEAGNITLGDTVIEIGPGEGVLTEKILQKFDELLSSISSKTNTPDPQYSSEDLKLIAIEKDDRLIPILQEKFRVYIERGVLEIIHGDILEMLDKTCDSIQNNYKIIANIPYYISGILMRTIFELKKLPSTVVLLVQKEVADRIVASDKKESMLSVSIKLYGTARRVSIVPKGAFVPAPNVDSAIISISNIIRTLSEKEELAFFEITKAAFSHKRKRMAKNLDGVMGKSAMEWEQALVQKGFDKNIRAEDVSVEQYVELITNKLHRS